MRSGSYLPDECRVLLRHLFHFANRAVTCSIPTLCSLDARLISRIAR
jgi:hypothetical protein